MAVQELLVHKVLMVEMGELEPQDLVDLPDLLVEMDLPVPLEELEPLVLVVLLVLLVAQELLVRLVGMVLMDSLEETDAQVSTLTTYDYKQKRNIFKLAVAAVIVLDLIITNLILQVLLVMLDLVVARA